MAEASRSISKSRSKPISICSFRLEREYNQEITAGIDEVGRGPLAGPVVVAGVVFSREFWIDQSPEILKFVERIDDSKRLREATREDLATFIKAHALAFEIVEVGPEIIDQINILQATYRGAREVVARLEEKIKKRIGLVLFDGPYKIPMLDHLQHSVVDGDRISKSIAAASILAKVHRDQLMKIYAEKFVDYGFASHKGYGTRQHLEAIDRFGMTSIHRRSFLKKFAALELGRASEDRVAERIEADGFRIIEKNWRMPSAEIDLIAIKDDEIHFFEVRSRSKPMDLQAMFSTAKQRQLEHAIRLYFLKNASMRGRSFHLHLATVIAGEIDFIWDIFKL